jgi:hypothetical protein
MAIQRLKLNVKYGMSTHPKAFRVHEINPHKSTVLWLPEEPRITRYTIEWWCTAPSRRTPLKLLSTLPEGEEICNTCMGVKELFQWNRARRQVRGENMINGPRYYQSPEAPF